MILVKLLDTNLHSLKNLVQSSHVHVAQLDRAFPSEGKGHGFDSHHEHHNILIIGGEDEFTKRQIYNSRSYSN